MELLKQHSLYSIGHFEFLIKINTDGAQSPSFRFFREESKPLEMLFVLHDSSLSNNWYLHTCNDFKRLDYKKFEKELSSMEIKQLQKLSSKSEYVLQEEISSTLSKTENMIVVDENHFMLEKIKHYKLEELIGIYGFLEKGFNEIKLEIQDLLCIKMRTTKSIVMNYFKMNSLTIVDTADLLELMKIWTQCIAYWKNNKIPNLKYPGDQMVCRTYTYS